MQNLSNALYQQPSIVMDELCVQQKKKKKNPLPLKSVSWRTVVTPYVGMTPKKNGGHIKSAQMTRSKCLR